MYGFLTGKNSPISAKKKRHWLKKYPQRKEAELQQVETAGTPLNPPPNEPHTEPGKEF